MKIETGTSRVAFVGEKLTVKLPLFFIKRALSDLRGVIRNKGMLKAYLTGSEGRPDSLAFSMLRGVNENRREATLSQEGHAILVPTRLSVFGLINIQDSATDVPIPDGEIYSEFFKKLVSVGAHLENEREMRGGAHTLPNSKNYGEHKGQIKLLDYGERGIDIVIRKYGHLLKAILEEKMAGL